MIVLKQAVHRAPWLLTALALSALPGVAHAADTPGVLADGKLVGLFAGALLLTLVGYALWLNARPVLDSSDDTVRPTLVGVVWLLLGLWVIKTLALAVLPGFGVDVGTYQAWALKITSGGPAQTYSPGYFLDYPPGYLYALWAAGWLARWGGFAHGTALRILVESPALAGDFLLAVTLYVFIRRRGRPLMAGLAAVLVALNPALLFDSMVWGQTDSIVTLVLFLSMVMMLDGEFEVGWGLAALGLLIKPQALTLLPILGLWTLLRCDRQRWWRAALAFFAIMVIGTAPFQIGHSWRWLPELYFATASFYHETSVNAFNLMALLGGVRQPDVTTFLGVSCFTIGITLLVLLYAVIAGLLWRAPTPRNLIFACFIGWFAFFMVAPRMHERYLYPAVVFIIPLAVEEPAMLAVFALVSLSCFANLAYVLHVLETTVFMNPRDPFAMIGAIVNVVILASAAYYGFAGASQSITVCTTPKGNQSELPTATEQWLRARAARWRQSPTPAFNDPVVVPPWLRRDTIILVLLLIVAGALRFWHLGHPAEIVFDEVHFVGQARHYLHGEPFLDPHPPLAKLLIAAGIWLFGDHAWAWRLGNATLGTILAGVTYMLGRRMFGSRLAATLAAAFILSDGMFLVDSRIGCIDIVYITFAAIAYLLLFRFIQVTDLKDRRRTLLATGVALGLCLGAKLYVPGITFLLVGGFVLFTLIRSAPGKITWNPIAQANRGIVGAGLMLSAVSAIFYIGCFLPHYYLGWWGGIANLFHYYKDVMWYEKSVASATHPYASPWWSWPLMLRPVAYWQNFPANANIVSTIWGAGNPLLWWTVVPAMVVTAIRTYDHPDLARAFLIIGYLAYLAIWVPITRILFLYHYMPSVYLGYLAVAAILADCWYGKCADWETIAILLSVAAVLIIGVGHIVSELKPAFIPVGLQSYAGIPLFIALAVGYALTIKNPLANGRFVFVTFTLCAFSLFIYFLPVWLGTPISRIGYYARMWLEGPGLRNWI